ncbi:MAG: hypothetical protein QOG68_546 [Solirubrobacteraceae bacterium]|nr:hypothetical protein [Solirubrobacteraceae bacterium]
MLADDRRAIAAPVQLAPAPAKRTVWRAVAERDPDALVTQTPEWVDVLCRSGYEDASRAYRAADGSRMVLPLVRRRGSLPRTLSPLTSLPSAWGIGGLLSERRPEVEDVAAVIADLRNQPAIRVLVRPNPLHARVWGQAARGFPLVVLPRHAHVLDLKGGAEEVWDRRFAGPMRRALRRAQTAGLDIRVGSTPELVGDFRRLYELAVRRSAEVRHEPQALAMLRAYRRDPPAKFVHIAEAMPDRLRVWIASRDGVPVAGLIVLLGTNASCARGAIDTSLPDAVRASELLHWHAIQEACVTGCAAYHMGESGTSTPLGEFKERLGARSIPYAAYCLERLPLQRSENVARAAVKRAIGFRDVDQA